MPVPGDSSTVRCPATCSRRRLHLGFSRVCQSILRLARRIRSSRGRVGQAGLLPRCLHFRVTVVQQALVVPYYHLWRARSVRSETGTPPPGPLRGSYTYSRHSFNKSAQYPEICIQTYHVQVSALFPQLPTPWHPSKVGWPKPPRHSHRERGRLGTAWVGYSLQPGGRGQRRLHVIGSTL